mgnify:CR=1 FL=1
MHFGIQNIIFIVVMIAAFGLFARSFGKIWRNIKLGREKDRSDRPGERWALMTRVAFGQSKMVKRRAVAGFFHVVIYVGFILINIEVAEIQQLIDSLPGGYRIIFVMYAIEGYKHHEIADLLNITEGTSKSQLFKARKMLQEKIKKTNKLSYGTN